MKLTGTPEIDIYRVQRRRLYPAYKYRPTHWWSRTWQAEWSGCKWAPRAYTRWGIERRAQRWYRRGGRPEWQIAAHRWIRRHVTQRADTRQPEASDA